MDKVDSMMFIIFDLDGLMWPWPFIFELHNVILSSLGAMEYLMSVSFIQNGSSHS